MRLYKFTRQTWCDSVIIPTSGRISTSGHVPCSHAILRASGYVPWCGRENWRGGDGQYFHTCLASGVQCTIRASNTD